MIGRLPARELPSDFPDSWAWPGSFSNPSEKEAAAAVPRKSRRETVMVPPDVCTQSAGQNTTSPRLHLFYTGPVVEPTVFMGFQLVMLRSGKTAIALSSCRLSAVCPEPVVLLFRRSKLEP